MADKETKAQREAREKKEREAAEKERQDKINALAKAAADDNRPYADDANEFVEQLLDQAGELQDEKDDLHKRIGANRGVLRQVKETRLLTAEQAFEIDSLYPPVQRGRGEGSSPDDSGEQTQD